MKQIATLISTAALLFNLCAASAYGQQTVSMTFSGTNLGTQIDLQPGTVTDDINLAGRGTLGSFTYRELHADALAPQSSSTCVGGAGLYLPTVAGGGVFRFQDGSLMTVSLTGGALCIDLAAGVAHFTGTYKVTGGTGRFKGASGTLTVKSTVLPVVFNANGPVLLINAGGIEGTISGVGMGEEE